VPSGNLPEYDKPPVNEVICGVSFKSLDRLLVPHIGVLWEAFKADYPTCQEVPPLMPFIEAFGERALEQKPEFAEIPPLPRVWFVHKNGNGVIQVQRDRFLHNWRKLDPKNRYPRFEQVFGMFVTHLDTFQTFLEKQKLGEINPSQYELTYVNHIHRGDGWETHADVGSIFADFVWRVKEGRFLPPPESVNWSASFVLPNKLGRLHATIRDALHREHGRPLYVFQLTARGFTGSESPETMNNWFDLAHRWIVHGFTDLTDERTQAGVWERTR